VRIFLWYELVIQSLTALLVLIVLATAEYPRTTKWTRAEDAFRVAGAIGMLVWCFYLLVHK
jgi:hypothetical protein